jgi:hypothetical protein
MKPTEQQPETDDGCDGSGRKRKAVKRIGGGAEKKKAKEQQPESDDDDLTF